MSTNPRIYLDFNATAPLLAVARVAMTEAMWVAGNPSSIHAEGRAARDLIERARNQVAALVGRPREELVFTSGGTEANVRGLTRLAAAALRRGLPRVVATTAIEHPSLRAAVASLAAAGWEVRTVGHWAEATGAGLFALGASNHELGLVIDPTGLDAVPGLVHVDAVQYAGKRAMTELAGVADSVAISAHKLGGPQGVGALISRIDEAPAGDDEPEAGHQERGRRPGTENVLGIVGFGAAAAAADPTAWPGVTALGERLEAGLRAIEGVRIHGADRPRIGGTVNAGFAGARGESIAMALDLAGIAVSTGAACTSGSVRPSPVLLAIGISEPQAKEAVRFSLGRSTTAVEIDEVIARLPAIVKRARDRRT